MNIFFSIFEPNCTQKQSALATDIHAYQSVRSAIKKVNLPLELRTFLDALRGKTEEELETYQKFFHIGSAVNKFDSE